MKQNRIKELIKDISLNDDSSIETAIQKLKNPYEIILIVNKENVLTGTVTDGDIRRALLKHFSHDQKLSTIMNKNPITCKERTPIESLNSLLKDHNIRQIPVLNEKGQVVDMHISNILETKRLHNNPVFLMAGGFGKRLKPLTNKTPKPMLKIGDKAILEIIIDSFIANGFQKFFISTHFEAEQIKNYFGDGSRMGVSINYVHEEEPIGTAGALGLLPKDLTLPIIMMNGDLITKIDFSKILDFHNKNSADITMGSRKFDFQVPYGVIKSDGKHVTGIEEKPIQSFFVNAGVYIINPGIFRNMNGSKYIDMPDFIKENMTLGKNVNIFPMHEYWLDIGKIENYKKAQTEITQLKDEDRLS